MSANGLYHTWFERIWQLRPDERITRLRNLVWLIVGIYQSKSVHLSDIASARWLKCFFGLTPGGKIGYDVSILWQEGEHHARSETTRGQLDG